MKCDFCGIDFEPQGNRNLTRRRFCSKKCYTDYWYYREPKPKERRTLKTVESKNCVVCGIEFAPDVNHPNALTCSQQCNVLRQRQKNAEVHKEIRTKKLSKPKKCPICGKLYTPIHWGQTYCSDVCSSEAHKIQQRVNLREKPKEFRVTKQKRSRMNGNWLRTMERDNYICQICGNKEKPNVHHLDGKGEKQKGKRQENNTELSNLIVLCDQCHKDIHRISLIKNGDGWVVQSKIFKKLGLSGTVKIINGE